MINKHHLIVIAILLFGGCASLQATTDTHDGIGGPEPYTNIQVNVNISTKDGFSIDGKLYIDSLGANKTEFHEISIRLLSDDGVQFYSTCLGNLSQTEDLHFSASSNSTPKWVLFTSDDFWDGTLDNFAVDYLLKIDQGSIGGYTSIYAANQSEYPVNISQPSPCD